MIINDVIGDEELDRVFHFYTNNNLRDEEVRRDSESIVAVKIGEKKGIVVFVENSFFNTNSVFLFDIVCTNKFVVEFEIHTFVFL